MIGRDASRTLSSGPVGSFSTLRRASSGSSLSTGSSSLSLPSSTNIMMATAVIGFVMDASANMVLRCMGIRAIQVLDAAR